MNKITGQLVAINIMDNTLTIQTTSRLQIDGILSQIFDGSNVTIIPVRKNNSSCWMQSRFGRVVRPFDPVPADFNLDVIASALSKKCRFNGHCQEFYSVAQHSVLVSQLLPDNIAMYGLMHEMDEVYLPDIPSPIKSALTEWEEISILHMRAGFHRYDLLYPMPSDITIRVNVADLKMLRAEKRDIMAPCDQEWPGMQDMPSADDVPTVVPWSMETAEATFLARFYQLRSLV